VFEGGPATSRRLPFRFQAHGGVGRLTLTDLAVGLVTIDRLDLEVTDLGTDPGAAAAERFQRRRTQLRGLAVRLAQPALDERVAQVKKQLAGTGITQLSARLTDGYISVRARAADGLAAADLSFHIDLVSAGAQLRALASTIRVHGHLPTPGPVIADRLLAALTGASDAARSSERPCLRGLCDVELDLVGALLWHVLPPSGWRLPAVSSIELTHIRVARAGLEVAYGPAGARPGELGVRKHTQQLAAAHDLMHSVDDQMRGGHLDDAMRGYRALLASGGPDQPLLLERILALAAARPAWFFDGLELARQALGRWPTFAPAHAALASITLAQGDAREAARHLEDGARMASAGSDDDQAALAALAAARLLRVLDPRAATQLYQLALEHDPASGEAADSLTDRLADEQRWSELIRLVRTRIATADPPRAVQLHVRLADVFVHQLGDHAAAQRELATARELAPDDPAVHEMTASILAPDDPAGAIAAWREVARLAAQRGDHRTGGRAHARLGDLLAAATAADAEDAWRRALQLDPMQSDAMVGLAQAAAARGDHAAAAGLYERLRGVGLAQAIAARHELALARSLIALDRGDDARASLRRATLAGGEAAAEAHAMLAEIAAATLDREHAAAELDTAIAALIDLAAGAPPDGDRLYTRAAELAVERAMLFDRSGQPIAAGADWQRAHALARQAAPEIARDAARTLLERSGDDASLERRWIDAVLATRPPLAERATLLVRRADVRRRERFPDLAAALADLHEAVELTEETVEAGDTELGPAATETRRRAYQLEAELFAQSGDQRSRARSLTAIARLAERASDRVESEAAAAAAWLAADEPAAALPHGARAHASLSSITDVPAALRREVLVTLGEAAWRQRAWPDVIRAYRGLLEDPGPEAHRQTTFRYRLAVAADRTGDAALALSALRPLTDDPDSARGASPELRAHALRLFADLAERAGELSAAATALEGFAAIGGESSAAARADAVYRAGELFRRIERGDDAIRCLETALRIADSHLPALDALEVAWRERGDLERVAVILGRKVAATVRQPGRQKPLLSRLGDLQDQLRRPDVALATHQRALEIDPMWRPSLRHVTLRLRDSGQVVAAAGGLAQLAGELHGDQGVDLAIVTRERQIAAEALSELVAKLDDAQVEAVRTVARPALERAALDNADVAAGLTRLRGEAVAQVTAHSEADTQSGRVAVAAGGALSLREAAARARTAKKLDEALATLETANHVSPGDPAVLRELVEIACDLHDYPTAARHLSALALVLTGARRGDALLELADIYYDRLDDSERGRDAMRQAAEAFGSGSRRDATLRLLATEAGTHLAWDVAVESLLAIAAEKRNQADFFNLATALMRAGRDADALAAIEAATAAGRFDDEGELLRQIQREIQRKTDLARTLEDRAGAGGSDAAAMLEEAQQLRIAIGQPGSQPLRDIAAPDGEAPKYDTAPWPLRTKTKPGLATKQVQPAPIGSRPRPSTTNPPPLGDADSSEDDGAPIATIPDDDALSGRVTSVLDTEAVRVAVAAAAAADAATDRSGRIPVAVPDTAAQRSGPIPVAVPDTAAQRSRPIPVAVPDTAAQRSGPIPVAVPDTAAQRSRPIPVAVPDTRAHRSRPVSIAHTAANRSGPIAIADRRRPSAAPDASGPIAGADRSGPIAGPEAVAARDPIAGSGSETGADADRSRSSPAVPLAALADLIDADRAMRSSPAIALADIADADQAPASSAAISLPPLEIPEPANAGSGPGVSVPEPIHDAPAITGAAAASPGVTAASPGPASGPLAPPPSTTPAAEPVASTPLGRIKLVQRVTTRRGLGTAGDPAVDAVPIPTSSDDSSGDWQSVSDPDLKSGPWAPLSAPRPGSSTRPPRRATSEPRLSSGAIVPVPDPPPDATIEATPPPVAHASPTAAPKARITALYAAVNVDDDPELSELAGSISDGAPAASPAAAEPSPAAKRPGAETPAQSPPRITSQYPLALVGPARLPARPSRAGFAPSESGAARDAGGEDLDDSIDDISDADATETATEAAAAATAGAPAAADSETSAPRWTPAIPAAPTAPRRSTAELPAPTVRPAFDRSGAHRMPAPDDAMNGDDAAAQTATDTAADAPSVPATAETVIADGTRSHGARAERATAPYDSASSEGAPADRAASDAAAADTTTTARAADDGAAIDGAAIDADWTTPDAPAVESVASHGTGSRGVVATERATAPYDSATPDSRSSTQDRAGSNGASTSATVESAMVESATVESAPAKSAPAESAPAETAPGETTPAETTPGETTPAETTPAETTPAETTPAETTLAETTLAETTLAETTPAESAKPRTERPTAPYDSAAADDNATADSETADRATVDRASADRASADQASADQASADRASTDRSSADRASADRATVARVPADGATADSATADSATADRATAGGMTADGPRADGMTADGMMADGPRADGMTADGMTADSSMADRATAASSTADRATADEANRSGATADGAAASAIEAAVTSTSPATDGEPLPHRPVLPSIPPLAAGATRAAAEPPVRPSVTITGTPEETQRALLLAAASADRERLFAARRADPDDPALLLALLVHLGDREPAVRRELLEEVVRTGHGRALAIALHELAVLARESRNAVHAMALWTRAYETDPSYAPVWMPLADAFAASDDIAAAREMYEAIAHSDSYDATRRAFAAERAEALGRDDSIVSGEIAAQREMTDLEEAEQLAAAEDWPGAIDAAERAAAASPEDLTVLEMLERIYFASGNVTAASEAVGRQLLLIEDPQLRASLWRRRARMYRDALGRDAEAYRCLKEAHACSPADPEIAYQLRTAAMVRGEWSLAASLLYREIAASANPRDRGALHLELAMIYEERLDDAAQAQVNFEQALAFDPTIPAVKLPLARRYEAIGRSSDAARLYEDAAGYARPVDRAGLLEAAARCRQAAAEAAEPDLAAQLDRAEAAGDLDAALELANQLWRAEPGHPAAFRTLANTHRASGDLAALTELTGVRVRRAETDDERATAWLEVARLAEELAAYDKAARAYDLALIEDPGHVGALDARGALAFRLGDFATADLIYRDLGPGESVLGDDELALRRSIIAEQLGRDSEALHLAQLAASLAPGRRDVVMRVQELATRVGELAIAISAARHVLELIPLDDDEAQLAVRFALVELLREAGMLDDAVVELERVLRDHPVHSGAIETLAHVHTARGDWAAVTRYLYQLVPLAPSPLHRAERLYQLGEAVLVHVNDIDRADDVFLRASDLDPGHVPTLRRLLDVYWRADDPGGIVEVATELADKGALINGPTPEGALARALVAAALVGDTALAQQLQLALGDDTPRRIADALTELVGRTGRLQLGSASIAITELARRGFLDIAKLRAAAAGTPVAKAL
jgi:Tfp pilus assembly protein PilF